MPLTADAFVAYTRATNRVGQAVWRTLSADERQAMIERELNAISADSGSPNGNVCLRVTQASGDELLEAYLRQ